MKTTTKNGLIIDFSAFIAKSGNTVAVGNARMNARGDVLSNGGLVEKTAEQAADDYYRKNPRAVSHTASLSSIEDELLSPADALKKIGSELALPAKRRKTSDD